MMLLLGGFGLNKMEICDKCGKIIKTNKWELCVTQDLDTGENIYLCKKCEEDYYNE